MLRGYSLMPASHHENSSSDWKPTASLHTLEYAAKLRQAIREWMQRQGVLEVCTPHLSYSANTDPQVESLEVLPPEGEVLQRYLHTSPEFAMKRLLCAYPDTDIYQIATVFRAEEQGRYHTNQFNLLEWYRVDMDHMALMQDVEALIVHIWQTFGRDFPGTDMRSYCQEVVKRLGQWPDELDGELVQKYFADRQRSFPDGLQTDVAASLDLFMDEFVLPEFDKSKVTFLFEYPASQAALARIATNDSGRQVAERFEVFFGQVELANGFHELSDATQQRQRFEADLHRRANRSQRSVPIDENLLAALSSGLPDCAGVALGIERLHMVLGGHDHIQQLVPFSDDNA